jgi:hypothetical protein
LCQPAPALRSKTAAATSSCAAARTRSARPPWGPGARQRRLEVDHVCQKGLGLAVEEALVALQLCAQSVQQWAKAVKLPPRFGCRVLAALLQGSQSIPDPPVLLELHLALGLVLCPVRVRSLGKGLWRGVNLSQLRLQGSRRVGRVGEGGGVCGVSPPWAWQETRPGQDSSAAAGRAPRQPQATSLTVQKKGPAQSQRRSPAP